MPRKKTPLLPPSPWRSPREIVGELCRLPAGDSLSSLPCPFHPTEPPAIHHYESEEGPIFVCTRCDRAWDTPELFMAKLAANLTAALTWGLKNEASQEDYQREISWRRLRGAFLRDWPDLQEKAREYADTRAELPFGEWGTIRATDIPTDWAGLLPGLTKQRRDFSPRLRLAFQLTRDRFGRPAGFGLRQVHNGRLIDLRATDFRTGSTGARLVFGKPPTLNELSGLVLAATPELAGKLESTMDNWAGPGALALLGRAGSLRDGPVGQVFLTGFADPERRARSLGYSTHYEPAFYSADVNAATHAGNFLRDAEPIDPDDPDANRESGRSFPVQDGRLLILDGLLSRESGNTQWAIANFSLVIAGVHREPDGELVHELHARFANREPLAFRVSTHGFHRHLRDRLWEACAAAGYPRPHLFDARLWRSLPDIVAALSEPALTAPPTQAPKTPSAATQLADRLFSAVNAGHPAIPRPRWSHQRHLIDVGENFHAFVIDERPLVISDLSEALQSLYGPRFGLVRTGRHKKRRALRIP